MATTFVLLYSGGRMPEGEAEMKATGEAWGVWLGKYGANVTDAGNPFTPAAKTIRPDGSVADGPVGTPLGGYTTITADSLDHAVTIAKECPVLLGGGSVSVYETFDAMSAMAGAGEHTH